MPGSKRNQSPCVGFCSTSFGDPICRGCKRFQHEVQHWRDYDEPTRAIVVDRIEDYCVQVAAHWLEIVDRALLAKSLQRRGILFNDQLHPACWAFALFRRTLDDPVEPVACGLKLKVALSQEELWQRMDGELHALSESYHLRYCARL